MDFVVILSGEYINQEMKIFKILSLYHVRFRNYDRLKYGPFSLVDTKPFKKKIVILKLLLFSHF